MWSRHTAWVRSTPFLAGDTVRHLRGGAGGLFQGGADRLGEPVSRRVRPRTAAGALRRPGLLQPGRARARKPVDDAGAHRAADPARMGPSPL